MGHIIASDMQSSTPQAEPARWSQIWMATTTNSRDDDRSERDDCADAGSLTAVVEVRFVEELQAQPGQGSTFHT